MHVGYACQNVEGTVLQPACLFVIIDCLQVLLYGSIHDRSNGKGFVIVQGAFNHELNKGGGYYGHCHKELHFFVKLPSAYFLHPLSHKCSRPSSVFCSLSYHVCSSAAIFISWKKLPPGYKSGSSSKITVTPLLFRQAVR